VVDLGTGDGRAVVATAAACPETFILGVDADAGAMAEASRRAAGRPSRGGLANASFVADGVERLPAGLEGIADRVTVRFPWGSLLRGALGIDHDVAGSIARLVAPGGELELTLSRIERDRVADGGPAPFGAADLDRLSVVFGSLGLDCIEARRLTASEVLATRSTWARRLRAGNADRPVWRVTFVRRGAGSLG